MVAPKRSRPVVWRIVTWLLLLLAIFGIFQYCTHAWLVVNLLRSGRAADASPLVATLVWDIVYLIAACITVSVAAGALLRRGWARPALRVVAAVLCGWLLVTAIMLIAHWSSFNNHGNQLLAQAHLGEAGQVLLERVRRRYLVAMVLKIVGVPILAWLAWRLGAPVVREQFLPRRNK